MIPDTVMCFIASLTHRDLVADLLARHAALQVFVRLRRRQRDVHAAQAPSERQRLQEEAVVPQRLAEPAHQIAHLPPISHRIRHISVGNNSIDMMRAPPPPHTHTQDDA